MGDGAGRRRYRRPRTEPRRAPVRSSWAVACSTWSTGPTAGRQTWAMALSSPAPRRTSSSPTAPPTDVRLARELGLRFTFVGHVAEAVEQARAVAGDKDVVIMGGGDVIAQAIDQGLADEAAPAPRPDDPRSRYSVVLATGCTSSTASATSDRRRTPCTSSTNASPPMGEETAALPRGARSERWDRGRPTPRSRTTPRRPRTAAPVRRGRSDRGS